MSIFLRRHDATLQSLRGIAAMTVLIGHCLITFRNGRIEDPLFSLQWDNLLLACLQLVVHANSAVMFFYVLSGLVLGESLRRDPSQSTRVSKFAIRRVFRLYPVVIPSILLGALVLTINANVVVPGMTTTMATAMHATYDGWTLIKNLLCIEYGINPLLWSVQVEVVMIAFLPALMEISRRMPLLADVGTLVVLFAIDLAFWNSLPNPLRFLYCFYLGLMLPRLFSIGVMQRVFTNLPLTLFALAVTVPIEWLYVSGRLWLPYKFATDTLISAQIIGFVLLRKDSIGSRVLKVRPLVFLGDISYSLYAYSMVIQFAVTGLIVPVFWHGEPTNNEATRAQLFLIAATTALTIPLAAASYFFIERHVIDAGRHLSESVALVFQRAMPTLTNFR